MKKKRANRGNVRFSPRIILLLTLSYLSMSDGCGSTPKILLPGIYESTQISIFPGISRACDDLRKTMTSWVDDGWSYCDSEIPGLSKITHGIQPNYFSLSSNDRPSRLKQCYKLTCNPNGNQKHRYILYEGVKYLVPDELENIQHENGYYRHQHRVTYTSLKDAIQQDSSLNREDNKFIKNLPLLNLHTRNDTTEAYYLGVKVGAYSFRLRRGTRPTAELLYDYNALPIDFKTNPRAYFQMIESYGCCVVTSGLMGGQFLLLSSKKLVQKALAGEKLEAPGRNKREVDQSDDGRSTTDVAGGAYNFGDSLKQWKLTVPAKPELMEYESINIAEFVDKDPASRRAQSFLTMSMFQAQHHTIRKILFELGVFKPQNPVSNFLIPLLAEEEKRICKSQELMRVIKEGILEADNAFLNKYYVKVTRADEETDTQKISITIVHYMLPHLCYSFDNTKYVKVVQNLESFCLVFYKDVNCKGDKSTLVKNEADALANFNEYRSFRICNPDDKKI